MNNFHFLFGSSDYLITFEYKLKMYMNFKEKVQSMTGKEIVMSMVTGLRKRWVNIDMSSFGHKTNDGVCFGCAASNTICEILGEVPEYFDSLDKNHHSLRAKGINPLDSEFVSNFEMAIDAIRKGWIDVYNYSASEHLNLPILPEIKNLPRLSDDFTEADLQAYEDYANSIVPVSA